MAEVVRKKIKWNCASHHDWDKWTDKRTWRIKKGTDFKCSLERMRLRLYSRANQKGMKVRTKKESKDVLVFQFYKA